MTPRVTVLMPVHNGAPFVAGAVASILAQTYRDFELLVVDDASTDGSADIAAAPGDPRVTIVRLPSQRGVTAALNEGLRAARGELVARQDADDLSRPHRLERQITAFEADARLALLGSQADRIDEANRTIGVVERSTDEVSIRWYSLFDNPMIHTSVMFRRAVVDSLGGYDPSYPLSQDFALWSRLVRSHRAANLPERLVKYRVRQDSVTGTLATESVGGGPSDRFAEAVRRIVGENLRAEFGSAVGDAGDLDLVPAFVLGVPRPALDRFLNLFDRLLAAYVARHPDALDSRDFARTVARQVDAIAYRVMPSRREAVWHVYRRALAFRPRVAMDISWPRALTLMLFGKSGRDAFNRYRSTMFRAA
jgi:hypothetical protein